MGYTHQQLADACMSLGLPEPPGEGTKRERVSQSFAALPDADLPIVAEQILARALADAFTRNAIQDVLWAEGSLEMSKRTRREVAAFDLSRCPLGAATLGRVKGLWHTHPGAGAFDLEGGGAGQVDRPGAIKEVRNAGLAGAAEDDVSALTTADAAVADGVPGARLDIVADHVLAMGADAVGSQFTDLGRDVLVLPLQPRGLPVQRGVAGSVIRLRRCLRARHGVGSPGVRLGYLRTQGGVAQQRYRRGSGERADDYDRGSHTEDDAPTAPFPGRRWRLLVVHRPSPFCWARVDPAPGMAGCTPAVMVRADGKS